MGSVRWDGDDQGVFVHVVYDESPKLPNVATESLRGSNDWTVLERVFDAPPDGGLIRVSFVHRPS